MKTHPSSGGALKYPWLLLWSLACGLVPQAHAAPVSEQFNTPGSTTWNAPAGVTQVTVEVWGGGGRGASRLTNGLGGGGGGGAYSRSVITVVPSTGYTVQVGAGSSTTAAGGDSFFINASTVMAKGGASAGDDSTTGAAGGAAGSGAGTVKFSGGAGANGVSSNGGGGGSSAGTASDGNAGSDTGTGGTAPTGGGAGGDGAPAAGNGTAGSTPGGGGGGSRATGGTPRTGGSGANGRVVLSYDDGVPEIAVFDGVGTGGTERTDNTGTHAFGSLLVGASSTAQSFTVENKGTADLTLSSITLGGTNSNQFSLNLTGLDSTLAPNETTTFTVTFSPTSTGAKTAVVNIASNDADESPFEINVSGTGIAPEIAVFNGVGTGGTERTDNTGTHTFGSISVGDSSTAQSFTVENKGTADLTLSSITLGGANSGQFSLDLTGLDTTLSANETTTFTVTFSPTSAGVKTAVVNIASDDADENPFEINVSGSGVVTDILVTDQSLTGSQGLVGGGLIYRPMPGVINNLDQVSFKAFGKVGSGGILAGNDSLLITDVSGDLHVIAREGTIVQAPTTLTGLFTDVLIDDDGHTVAFDRIKGSLATRDQAYFISENGIDLEILSRTGDNAPGGGKFKPVNRSIVVDSDGRTYFSSGLTGTGVNTKTDTGIWQEEAGTVTLLAREGADVSTLTGDPAWLGTISAKLSAAGDGVAFVAHLQNNPVSLTQKTNANLNTVVLSGNENGLELVARKGDIVPDTADQTLLTLHGVSRSTTGAHAVLGLLKPSLAVTKSNDLVLISVSGGTTRLVAREGVTLIGGTTLKNVRAFYAIGDEELIFLTDRALCRWTVSGGITVLARIGSAAPGLGSNFKLMNQLSVSEGGAIALVTTLVDFRTALWRVMPGGGITLAHVTGEAITVNATPETIAGMAIYTATTSSGGGGGGSGSAINDAGTIFATFSVGGGKHVGRRVVP